MSNFYYDSDIPVEVFNENKVSRKIKACDSGLMMVEAYFENNGKGDMHTHVHE